MTRTDLVQRIVRTALLLGKHDDESNGRDILADVLHVLELDGRDVSDELRIALDNYMHESLVRRHGADNVAPYATPE